MINFRNLEHNKIKAYMFIQWYKDEDFDFDDTSYIDSIYENFIHSLLEFQFINENITESDLKIKIYDIGKKYYGEKNLRNWFSDIYKFLMNKKEGPRLDTFIKLYGINEWNNKIKNRLLYPEFWILN